MTQAELILRHDQSNGRLKFLHFDRWGYPYFEGHHPGGGTFNLEFMEGYEPGEGWWLFNRHQPVPISKKAERWKPFIPDHLDGPPVKYESIIRLIKDFNHLLIPRYQPGNWKNIINSGSSHFKHMFMIFKIWGKRVGINVPEEIFFLITNFTSILLPDGQTLKLKRREIDF